MSTEDNVKVTVKVGSFMCEKGRFSKGESFEAPRSYAEKFDLTFVSITESPKPPVPTVEPVVDVKPAVAPVPLEVKPVVKKSATWSTTATKKAAAIPIVNSSSA